MERPPHDAPYRNRRLSTKERVDDLLGRMTIEEKVAQLTSAWLALDTDAGEVVPYRGNLLAGDPGSVDAILQHGIGQLTRPYGSRPVDPVKGVRLLNALQRRLVDETRLGIPALVHEECLTGFMAWGATAMPSPLNMAACWDPGPVERVGRAIRDQMRSVGVHQGLAPVMDVVRDARWGRTEETFGEDRYLVGQTGAAYVRGLDGGARNGIIATLKHFLGYSSSEGGRNLAPSHVGLREIIDVFAPPFETAIREGGARSVMNAYQDIDGVPVAMSRTILTTLLRDWMHFEGTVVSDYFSIAFLHQLHGVADDVVHAGALALSAGLDVELPTPACYGRALMDALGRGLVTLSEIDRSVERVIRQKVDIGLLDDPEVAVPERLDLDPPGARALAAEVARRSIVLLKNDGVLPIAAPARVAVIGPNAATAQSLLGNYTFANHVAHQFPDAPVAPTVASVLDAMTERCAEVIHAAGCDVVGDDTTGFVDALAAVREADVAVVVVGDQPGHFGRGTSGEGTDTDDLALPGVQQELVMAVVGTGTPTIVVLVVGRPYAIPWIAEHATAVVCAFLPGEEGAAAIADVLTGAVGPSGRTPVTFGRGAGQQPMTYDHRRLARGGYARSSTRPVFPFGHGLTYTTFEWSDLSVTPDAVPTDGSVTVTCRVQNTGGRAGDAVAQLYISDPVASVTRPVIELKGYQRVALEPGQAATITFDMPTDLLAFTGVTLERIVEPGEIQVLIGESSTDIRLRGGFVLVGDTRRAGGRRALTTKSRAEVHAAAG